MPRVDHKKNLQKILKQYLKDPDQTLEQIGDIVGLDPSTVSRALKELQESAKIQKSSDILDLTKKDLEDIKSIQELEGNEITKHLNLSREKVTVTVKDENGEDKLDEHGNVITEEVDKWPMKPTELKAISQIGEIKQKRRAVLLGDVTDEDGGLVSPEDRERSNTLINDFLKGDTSE